MEHKGAGFMVSIPAGWRVAHNFLGAAVAAIAPDGSGYAPNMNVVCHDLDDGFTRDAFTEHHLASLGHFLTDVVLVDREEFELDGHPGVRLLLHYRQGIFEITLTQWLVAGGGRVFVISTACTSSASAQMWQAFADIAASFELS